MKPWDFFNRKFFFLCAFLITTTTQISGCGREPAPAPIPVVEPAPAPPPPESIPPPVTPIPTGDTDTMGYRVPSAHTELGEEKD